MPIADDTEPARGSMPTAASTSATPADHVSDDGLWRWDGYQWIPVKQKTKTSRWKIGVGVAVGLVLLVALMTPGSGSGPDPDDPANVGGLAVFLLVWQLVFLVGVLALILSVFQARATRRRKAPAGRAGRIAGEAVNAGTMTPALAMDAWQQWHDQSQVAGRDFRHGYRATGAARW